MEDKMIMKINKKVSFFNFTKRVLLILFPFYFSSAQIITAQFHVKNNNPYNISCSIGYFHESSNKWISVGWYKVRAFETETLLLNPLKYRYYYMYVEDVHGNIWDGSNDSYGSFFNIRIGKAFDSRTLDNSDAVSKKFYRVDRGNYTNCTLPISAEAFGENGQIGKGYGSFYYEGCSYLGYFSNYKPNGEGVMYYNDGSNYSGNFYNGLPDGNGTIMTKEGYSIEGWWNVGKLDGSLTLRVDGKKLTGEAKNNLPVGNFKCYDERGILYQVIRFDGDKINYIPSPTIRWLRNSTEEIVVNKNTFIVNACVESQSEVTEVYVFVNGEQVYSTTKYPTQQTETTSDFFNLDSSIPLGIKSGDMISMLIPVKKQRENINYDCANEVNTKVNLIIGNNRIYIKAKSVSGSSFSKTITVRYE